MMNGQTNSNYGVSLLVFGQLGKSSEISFSTIRNLNCKSICVMGDKSGIEWISGISEKLNCHNLCVHIPSPKDLDALKLSFTEESKYSNFGNERFIKLTTFKWYLIKDVLNRHQDLNFTLFSDLDIIWLQDPSINNFAKFENTFLFVQDDSPLNNQTEHVCSGVMFWRNNNNSKETLKLLFENQLKANVEGYLFPDEPILNLWIKNNTKKDFYRLLPKSEYVIGHRFFHLILKFGFSFNNLICFHANYVKGEKRKLRRMKILIDRINNGTYWIIYFPIEILLKFWSMLIEKGKK